MIEHRPPTTIDDDLQWTAVSWDQPCPVCAARRGCGTASFRGGVAVDCRNVVSAWPMTQGGWLHRLPGHRSASDLPIDVDGASCAYPMPS